MSFSIVFGRHLDLFAKTFPALKVVKTEVYNLSVHLVAGSFNQKSPFPPCCYPLAEGLDRFLRPVRELTGMSLHVVLEKAPDTRRQA